MRRRKTNIYDLPQFILNELSSGPYGPEVTADINYIRERYDIYQHGSDFDVDVADDSEHSPEKDYEPTVFKSRKVKRLIDREAEFMVGKTPEIKIVCKTKHEDSDEYQSNIQSYIGSVLKRTNFAGKILRGARDCFIGGRVLLKINVQPDTITLQFIPADFFIYRSKPDNIDELGDVIIWFPVVDTEDKNEQRWWRQKYYIKDDKCFVVETLYDGYGRVIEAAEDRWTGLSEIPCIPILNGGLSGDVDGESDVDAICGEDSAYNDMRSRNMDSLKKNMNPMKYILGALPKTFGKLSTKPGAINDIPSDPLMKGQLPEIGQLESNFQFNTSYQDTTNSIVAEMYENLGIPDVRAAATSGLVTSGKGLEALYWPLICRCQEKWTAWGPALEKMARIIIDAAEVYPRLKEKYGRFQRDDDYDVVIESQYALPTQEDEERELDLREVGTGRSIRSYLMKWGGPEHSGLTAEKADEEIAQMVKEKRMLEEIYDNGDFDDEDDE